MKYTCSITGREVDEKEGIFWTDLRPALQDFFKTIGPELGDSSFISFNALNVTLRAYIAKLTEEEIKARKELLEGQREKYETDKRLQPINPDLDEEQFTFGERLADKIAEFGGSWRFIIFFFLVLVGWITLNVLILKARPFDPYPFILLNLILSCLAALQAPIIMMSQNRIEARDRVRNEYDFKVDMKAEKEIRFLHEKIDHILLHQHQSISELFQLHLDLMQQVQQRADKKE